MSSGNYPAIVVNAYNRPVALQRLLDSLRRAVYPPGANLTLHISIDRGQDGCSQPVRAIAERCPWPFGEKQVVCQDQRLGLVRHFYHCGDLTRLYGPIVYLEDDLVVSPVYYLYACQALAAYQEDERIAGICLYALWFNGYTHQPFYPLEDEADVFFLQVPYYHGQAFTPAQWGRFAEWREAGNPRPASSDSLHEAFLHFDPEDWFPIRMKYLVQTGRTVVFPRQSLATGFGDAGTHFSRPSAFFQVPLQRFKTEYRLKGLDDSVAVYDSFYEILPSRLDRLTDRFRKYLYEVDLNGTKSRAYLQRREGVEYVLTTRRCAEPLLTFGRAMFPPEANLIEGVPGWEIAFGRVKDLDWSWLASLSLQKRAYGYFTRRRSLGKKQRLQFFLLDLMDKARFWWGNDV